MPVFSEGTVKKKMYLEEDRSKGSRIFEFIVEIAVIVAFGLFLTNFLFFNTENASKAMEPTIRQDSVVFSNRFAYAIGNPKRFDVVAFYRTDRMAGVNNRDILVRRVIALPGETIRIYRGRVYINGRELDVGPYLSEITSDGIAETEIRLNQNEYFLMGDMPANSEDSRSTTIGVVMRRQIVGKAWLYATTITDIHFIR